MLVDGFFFPLRTTGTLIDTSEHWKLGHYRVTLFFQQFIFGCVSSYTLKLGQVFRVNPHQLFLRKDCWCFKKTCLIVHCLDSCYSRRRLCFTQKSCFLSPTILKFFKGNPSTVCKHLCLLELWLLSKYAESQAVCKKYLDELLVSCSCREVGDYFILSRKQKV